MATMNPVDANSFHQALASEGTLVKQHEQTLREVMENLQNLVSTRHELVTRQTKYPFISHSQPEDTNPSPANPLLNPFLALQLPSPKNPNFQNQGSTVWPTIPQSSVQCSKSSFWLRSEWAGKGKIALYNETNIPDALISWVTLVAQSDISLGLFDLLLEASMLDGSLLACVIHRKEPIHLVSSGIHYEKMQFYLFTSPKSPLVLCLPWLRCYNTHIDWSMSRIISWSNFCHSLCLQSTKPSIEVSFIWTQAPRDVVCPLEHHDRQSFH